MVYALPATRSAPWPATVRCRPRSRRSCARTNLNDPLIVQYVKYLGDLVQFDLGTDFRGREVTDTISSACR